MDGDAALSLGYPHLLPTVGTLKVAVISVTHPDGNLLTAPAKRSGDLKKPCILCPPAIQLPGEASKQSDKDQHQRDPIKHCQTGDEGKQIKDQIDDDQSVVQLIGAIPACHKLGEKSPNQSVLTSRNRVIER